MNRNIAFFISSNKEKNKDFLSAKNHFFNIANEFGYKIFSLETKTLKIFITAEKKVTVTRRKDFIKFPVGNLGENSTKNDRFLEIIISDNTVTITNDYAGSIPTYFSLKKYISLSNIEPCVILDSSTKQSDISYENTYGFMRYSHFIWDETLYEHIFTVLPDSEYIFNVKKLSFHPRYLQTVKSSQTNVGLSDKEIATKLNELNDRLIYQSLSKYDQIILPLSSGYDSRMILASVSKNKNLKNKLQCFTYGSIGSVEVEAGRRLTKKLGVKWKFLDLPLHYLTKKYLFNTHDIFGSSLHMHGMYQLEFFDEIKKMINVQKNSCLTSGFMTGVPAGQHNGLLSINKSTTSLTDIMNKFSQSRYWTDDELMKLEAFKNKNYRAKTEERFQLAFNRFDGKVYQKAVMFDIWTRQRNFISYYPRILEWKIPTISPHMNPDYANFFMSLSKKHLNNRYAVELMFINYYPKLSKIVSNSNGLKSIDGHLDNIMFFCSRIFKRFKIHYLIPKKYAKNRFEFDLSALRLTGKDSIYPLLRKDKKTASFINEIIIYKDIDKLYQAAYKGKLAAYGKLLTIQSIALSMLKIKKYES
ncbi:MAG: hypothetical protein KAV41_00060 [Candidatus Pacebacteria bacterium]|nr:hypothetical protein [Candidatus Paceibacterota bacterium]